MSRHDTNLAAEFYILSCLKRMPVAVLVASLIVLRLKSQERSRQ